MAVAASSLLLTGTRSCSVVADSKLCPGRLAPPVDPNPTGTKTLLRSAALLLGDLPHDLSTCVNPRHAVVQVSA